MKIEKFKNTYSDLQECIKLINTNIIEYKVSDKAEKIMCELYLDSSTSNEIKFLFGIKYLGVELKEAFQIFKSNRYFLDSIGLDTLPSFEKTNNLLNDLIIKYESDLNKIAEFYHSLDATKNIKKNHNIDFDFLDQNGYIIVKDVLNLDLCDRLYDLTLEIEEYERITLRSGYKYGGGNANRVYSLISKSKLYQDLCETPIIHEVMNHLFFRETFHEKYYLTSFHANIIGSQEESNIWHIDANVPDPIPPWIIRANSNIIVHEYNANNGATQIIPGSHKWLRKPNMNQIRDDHLEMIDIIAPKGSIVFWHGHLWHRSGKNNSSNPRVALLGAYSASFLREVCLEENPYLNLNINQIQTLTPKLKKILGWDHGSKFYNF
jgi:ectoine hydroxylase-related dioxygenase (phytanoyl-CoA dioxygenase family)